MESKSEAGRQLFATEDFLIQVVPIGVSLPIVRVTGRLTLARARCAKLTTSLYSASLTMLFRSRSNAKRFLTAALTASALSFPHSLEAQVGRWFDSSKDSRKASARETLASRQAAKPSAAESAGATKDDIEISLSYLDTPWHKVLREIAEESGKTLVMDRAPAGRLQRYDRKKYSLKEAIRVVNPMLEREGFRLVEMHEYLVVMHLKSARSKYARPEIAAQLADKVRGIPDHKVAPLNGNPQFQRKFSNVGPQRSQQPPGRIQPWLGGDIRPVGFEDDGKTQQAAPAEPASSKPVQQSVQLRHQKAVEVARKVYAAFKSRAKLIHQGPQGLPAFEVHDSSVTHALLNDGQTNAVVKQNAAALFTVAIDANKNQLFVQGPADRVKGVSGLIQRLDVAGADPNETIQFFPATQKEAAVASKLAPQIKRLVQERQKPARPVSAQRRMDEFDRAFQLAQGNVQPLPDKRPGATPNTEPNVAGNLLNNGNATQQPNGATEDLPFDRIRSNVDIDVVPGVGLVLKGNLDDVNAVMDIIAGIVKASRGAVPNIHLLTLRHVNSEALAELLTAVYERLDQLRTRGLEQNANANEPTLAFFPVVKPNAILILASGVDMESVLALADELDTPVDPTAELEVFALRFAIASQVKETLDEFYEDREGLGTRVRISIDFRTNSLIVHARPSDLDEVKLAIQKIDRDESGAVSSLKILHLKNAVAEELAEVINGAIQGTLNPGSSSGLTEAATAAASGASAQQLREAKSVVLEFLHEMDGQPAKVKSGLLADVRITFDTRINALLVSAPTQSLAMVEAMVKQLDQPSPTVAEIKVFSLENSDATQAADLLTTLFGEQNQQDEIGVQLAGAEDAASSLVPLRFSVDVRTNSIVAVGGAEALSIVEAVLLRLDESDVRRRTTTVVELRNSPVTEVAEAINTFLTSQRELAQLDPDLVSNVELLEREIIVVPESVTNNLLVSATPRYYSDIMKMIERLDEAPPQVQIQALLVEVELDNVDEFGVELGFQDSVLFNRSLIDEVVTISETFTNPNGNQTTNQTVISQTGTPGFNFNNVALGNNVSTGASRGSVGSQGLSNFNLGRVNSDLDFGGFVFSASSDSVNVLVRALAARRNVHILSRPQIRTVDNQLAQILVGQEVPVIDGVNVTDDGIAQPQVRQDESGIILTVQPRVSPDGTIVMETVAEKSEYGADGVPLFVDSNGQSFISPIKDVITASTTVAVPNGQTVVLGGMITKSDDTLERKVPWLGDIPVLGIPFRYDSTTTRRTELLIFLTPRIILNNQESEVIKQVESERTHFFQQEAEEIHGPLYAVPEGLDMKASGGTTPIAPAKPSITPPPVPASEGSADTNSGSDAPATIVPQGALVLPPTEIDNLGARTLNEVRRR